MISNVHWAAINAIRAAADEAVGFKGEYTVADFIDAIAPHLAELGSPPGAVTTASILRVLGFGPGEE